MLESVSIEVFSLNMWFQLNFIIVDNDDEEALIFFRMGCQAINIHLKHISN